jgi:RNA polymerase sigma-70 factor (ECF subfamily)
MTSPPPVDTLLQNRRTALYLLALQRLRSHADAEDAVQETALRCLSVDWATVLSPDGLLTTIHLNVIRDMARRRSSQATALPPADAVHGGASLERVPCPNPGPEQILYWRQRLSHLAALVQELPPRARKVFTLRRCEGLSHAEIAEQEHMSAAAVEKNVVRALRRLRKEMAND